MVQRAEHRAGTEARRNTYAPLAGVVFLGLLLRVAFFSGYSGTDDTYYIQAAYRVSVGDFTAFDSHFAVRSGLVLPTAAAYRTLGVSLLTTALLPLCCSLAGLLVAFALGQRLFDRRVGLLAALLVAVLPLDVIFASELFACTPVALLTGVVAYCLVCDNAARTAGPAFAAGLCLGVATLAADTAWFCLLPVGYYFVFVSTRRRRALVLMAGLVCPLLLEARLYSVVVGDAWWRWRVMADAIGRQGSDALSSGLGLAYLIQPFLRLVTEQEFGLFPLVLLPALAYHTWRAPSRYSRFLVFWVIAIFLYTSYGTVSPFRFAPLPRLPRYLSSTMIPATVLLASFLLIWGARWRRSVVAVLCATSVLCIWLDNGRTVKAPRKALHAFVVAHPRAQVVLGSRLLFDELFFNGFKAPARLSVVVDNRAAGQAIEEHRSLYGPVQIVRDLHAVRGAYVALHGGSGLDLARSAPGAELVASFRPPDSLYYRLLRSPQVLRLLSFARDRYRIEGLQLLPAERVDVYYVP
jgi:4-amino-4-deoxy-L-arabinose transferase-like glycosyltransferase